MAVDEDISDTQPFLAEESTADSRGGENDDDGELTLTTVSAPTHSTPQLQDSAWATAFKINVGITVLCALCFSSSGLTKLASVERVLGGQRVESEEGEGSGILSTLIWSVIIGSALSWVLLKMITVRPEFGIKVCN